ncbi:unnamed protein product, partial [Rotaria sp. Silwood1]
WMGNSNSIPSSYMVIKANQFISQETEFRWFMGEKGGGHGQDTFERRVVLTTFPIDLQQEEFNEYVNKKFCDRDENTRNKIAALFKVNTDCDDEKNVTFNYEPNGGISATLTQIVFEREHSRREIRISVGYTRCIRKPKQNERLDFNYWKSNQDNVIKALQFLFGKDLKQELAFLKQ